MDGSAKGRKRITVGVLFNSHMYTGMYPNQFASSIIGGIQAAARDQDINLLVACGVSRGSHPIQSHPAWPEPLDGVDFLPVGPWNTDGLLVFSPLHTPERIRSLKRMEGLRTPIVYIGSGTGTPAITVDNEGGIRQVLEHLVGHGHRSIAFVAGDPDDPGDSAARIRAYRRCVRELGLADDPRLMEYGLHWDEAAYHAIRRILDSGVEFTAVLCSNDQSAQGVVRGLIEAGRQIPWDVAVAGFDDQPEALTLIPPLTSVHYPLFETGYRALLLLRKRIEQGPEEIPETVRVFTQLMPRQSCGCIPQADHPVLDHCRAAVAADRSDPDSYREDLAQAMIEAMMSQRAPESLPETRMLCDRLVSAFLQSLQDGDLSHFHVAMIDILQRIELLEEDAHAWQAAVSVLRLCVQTPPAGRTIPGHAHLAEDLLHQARTLLSDSARRRYNRLQLLQTFHDEAMGRLTARLLSALEEEQVYAALADGLPRVGIRNCRVVFFEPGEGDPLAGSRLSTKGKDCPGLRFETRAFPAPGLYPQSEPLNLALLPLFYQQENLGYVAFDGGNLDPLATIVIQLATAVKNVRLHARVLELSLTDSLTGVYNRRYFNILLEKEAGRSRRYRRDLAVIMIDIDRFKEYNDAFGHPAGDEALREVARSIREGARRGLDVVTRYGGEEFAIILPETDADGAWTVAETVRRGIERSNRFLRRLTVSAGISTFGRETSDPQNLIRQADRALYQAKRQGRNRSVRFEEGMQEFAHPSPIER